MFHRFIALVIAGLSISGCSHSFEQEHRAMLVPQIDGAPWVVAGDPDLGELTSPKQQPVDFSVWQAADGTWQLWSCVRNTQVGGKSRLFHRWEGASITTPDWKPMGIAMKADEKYGETPGGLQAPHVIRRGADDFVMFYGDWVHICLATSTDGKTFERAFMREPDKTALFSEGPQDNTRDPMALRIGNLWYCYYTGYPNKQGTDFCRVSSDLKNWSEPWIISIGGKGGLGGTRAECPFVAYRGGYYYLFRTQNYGETATTHVYRSTDPLKFNIHSDTGFVCTLPVAAPEIISHQGQDYIAYLLPSLKGIQIAKLIWAHNAEN